MASPRANGGGLSATPPLHDGRVWWSHGEAWRWRHAAVDLGGRLGGDATPGERAHGAPIPAPPATVGGGASAIGEGHIAPGRRVSSPSRVRRALEARVGGAGGRWGDPSLLALALPPHILLRTHSRSASAGSNTGYLPAPNFGLSAVCAPARVPRPGARQASSAGGPPPPPQNLSAPIVCPPPRARTQGIRTRQTSAFFLLPQAVLWPRLRTPGPGSSGRLRAATHRHRPALPARESALDPRR